jgi:hypothetical protein
MMRLGALGRVSATLLWGAVLGWGCPREGASGFFARGSDAGFLLGFALDFFIGIFSILLR